MSLFNPGDLIGLRVAGEVWTAEDCDAWGLGIVLEVLEGEFRTFDEKHMTHECCPKRNQGYRVYFFSHPRETSLVWWDCEMKKAYG